MHDSLSHDCHCRTRLLGLPSHTSLYSCIRLLLLMGYHALLIFHSYNSWLRLRLLLFESEQGHCYLMQMFKPSVSSCSQWPIHLPRLPPQSRYSCFVLWSKVIHTPIHLRQPISWHPLGWSLPNQSRIHLRATLRVTLRKEERRGWGRIPRRRRYLIVRVLWWFL